MFYKSKLINAAKFYKDCSFSFVRKVSLPFTAPVSRRRMRLVSHVKSLCAQQGRTKFYKYRRLAFYMI